MVLSHRLAVLLLRLPLSHGLNGRLASAVDRGRLDHTDALAGLIRYIAMGGMATAVYFFSAVALDRAGAGATVTSAIAITVSVIVSFVAQSRVTFRSSRWHRREALRFMVVGALGFTISRGAIDLVHLRAGQPFWLAALVVCLIVPLTNFAAMNFWVFAGGWGERS